MQARDVGMLASAFLAISCSVGVGYCYGLFFNELLAEFGEGRASTALAGSLHTGFLAGSTFLSAHINTTLGIRRGAMIGAGLSALGLILASFATELWHVWLSYGVLTGTGHSLIQHSSLVAINLHFQTNRAVAVGVGSSGGGGGGLILGLIIQAWLANASSGGWRTAFLAIAALDASAVPICAVMFGFAEEEAALAALARLDVSEDGAPPLASPAAAAAPKPIGTPLPLAVSKQTMPMPLSQLMSLKGAASSSR